MDERIRAVIDADFFRKITEYEHGPKLFLRVMNELNLQPVMHEFVAETELNGNQYLQKLLDTGMVDVIRYSDYLKEEDKKPYENYFREALERINYYSFPKGEDPYIYADRGESLGEIRSLYMARKMGCPYFMSDDADAGTLTRSFFSRKSGITVQTLYEVFVLCRERGTSLTWKDIKVTATNAMRTRQKKLNMLKEIYGNSKEHEKTDLKR